MRHLLARTWPLLCWLVLEGLSGLLRGETSPAPARIEALVAQLGADGFRAREQAMAELQAIGPAALPALRRALQTTGDAEVRRRAQRLYVAIALAVRKSPATGLELALIDAGRFAMGSPDAEVGRRGDETLHWTRVTLPFLLGTGEVSQAQYQQVMGRNPSWFSAAGPGREKIGDRKTDHYPVEQVTWFDAIAFCNRLSELDRQPPYYTLTDVRREKEAIVEGKVVVVGGPGYRLPTEAEWELACRAGSLQRFSFGDSSTGQQANVKSTVSTGGYGGTAEVQLGHTTYAGHFPRNAWGLFDMHGNVSEWCWDWYDKDYYAQAPLDDPQGPATGRHRVHRGGSWLLSDASCRSASRFFSPPGEASYTTGFRVARSP